MAASLPPAPVADMKTELLARLAPFAQTHVLDHWDRLAAPARAALAAQIEALDLELIARLFQDQAGGPDWKSLAEQAEPPAAIRLAGGDHPISAGAAQAAGEAALARGEIAALIVAGGQGTRLGFDQPKGLYPIGPVSGASLFQILFERVLALGARFGRGIPIYVMTSPATARETAEFLRAHDRFGVAADDLILFCQGTMPAVDAASGKLLLAEPGKLFESPDGHGGTLAALQKSGALASLRRRGLRHLFYVQIDNPLAPLCDPTFLGYHLLSQSEMTTLVAAKHAPKDKVGNFVSLGGQARIIEYSDLPDGPGARLNPDGSLRLWAGNTAMHVFSGDFLERMSGLATSLPFHIAHKTVPYVDPQGRTIEPERPNAIKFERFIFDLLPQAKNPLAIEVDERVAFMPLKNAPGEPRDTPDSVRQAMVELHRGWLRSAGVKVADDVAVEISPRFGLSAADCQQRLRQGTELTAARYFSMRDVGPAQT
ncbi:MAG TPA: UTP--glucose-1-phosphate uridylyltransferase [Pirellulales bacterium]|jgi:UDP-N-acetylglucosamine/UDP-N-acetylgalactosamine diphosphorylase|nr:UTP--glucose-1-phosphate uridylyltransferase [Pirellulales bacterium]